MTPTEREANEDYRDILCEINERLDKLRGLIRIYEDILCELDSRLDELRVLVREYPPLDTSKALRMMREFVAEWEALAPPPQADYDSGWDFMGELE